jgi:hypothetical protein
MIQLVFGPWREFSVFHPVDARKTHPRISRERRRESVILGERRLCTVSIHWPGRSARAAKFSGRVNHSVSKRPIWLAEAA